MGRVGETIRAVNAFVRTVFLGALVALVAAGGYIGYSEYYRAERRLKEQARRLDEAEARARSLQQELVAKEKQIRDLGEEIRVRDQRIERLELARKLLTTEQRLARLTVVDIRTDEQDNVLSSTVEFVELNPAGEPISEPKRFDLEGDVVYIDNWVVKFDDRFIEQADLERGTSLCLFRRIFSESQSPAEGFALDEVGMRPQAYARGGQLSDFERQLWREFWEFANNPEKAAAMGIRAANGEAVSIKVREGMAYHLVLRNSGGLSIQPIRNAGQKL
ncbi:MAG: hypothetical protein KatS3mg111_2150 [Pirellulaceae bacterium]|nr:MAG: hypothetical protein KatS3mg111_2150 [Pirellulaceae bacterium]